MSVQSTNVYRVSWLSWAARVFCWPLALFVFLGALAVRGIAIPFHGLRGRGEEDSHVEEAARNWKQFAASGWRYLSFQTSEFPALSGRVREGAETPGPWYEAKRRLVKSHVAMLSVIVFVTYVYVGLAAQMGWIASDFRETTRGAEFLMPFESKEATGERPTVGPYVLGTDQLGHSVLSLALRGTTTALWIGLFAASISSLIGVILGALAGYFGGWIDDLIVWAYTTLSAIPYLLLLMAFSYVFKNSSGVTDWYTGTFLFQSWGLSVGLFVIIVALGLTTWVGTCRIVRAEFIKHRDRDYVQAALSLGYSKSRVIFRHILPNVLHLVLITFSLLFIGAIKFEVILSFLGLGLEPSEASWGNMISKGAGELLRADIVWWQITTATAALFGLVLSVNLFADAMRDALDPRLRK